MNRPGGRPEWAIRLRQEREARDWTQEGVIRRMRSTADHPLPEDLLTTYKRYERGKHFPMSYAPLLATVFGMDVDTLFGSRRAVRPTITSATERSVDTPASASLDSLRQALIQPVCPRHASDPVRLRETVLRAHVLYQSADYDGAAALLPGLIADVETGPTVRPETVAATYVVAAKLATKLGDGGLAWVAADRCSRAAEHSGEAALRGVARYQVACALLRSQHSDAAEQVAEEAAESSAGRLARSPADLSARGSLLLLSAVLAARRGDGVRAHRFLADARLLAGELGKDANWLWTGFGPTNVDIHELSVQVAMGDSRAGLDLGGRLDTDGMPAVLRGRRSQVHLELGWAAVGENDDSLAVLHLLEAERVAEQVVRRSVFARSLISTLLGRERRGTAPGLRALADRAGVSA